MLDWLFKLAKRETRSSGSGYTAEIMAARESYISGRSGVGELTATVQSCVTLWENGIGLADVSGTELLSRHVMSMVGRSLALRGEALFVIGDDRVVPASDWEVRTRDGEPTAYRVSISEAGGGTTRTALAGEVLHFRIGADPVAPWIGTAPLRRAAISTRTLQAIEAALAEVFEFAPLGSAVLPFPESPRPDSEALQRSFRGQRGRILLRESVFVVAGGGPTPSADWRPSSLSPDLARAATAEHLAAAQNSVLNVYGVLPGLVDPKSAGPSIREGQRHLAQWTLAPIAALIAEEASNKLGTRIELDVMRPLQAYDSGGRARALSGVVQALVQAKDAGLDPSAAAKLVDWRLD
ncbi:MAG: phage portal protein [Pseudomonadota bacterium]